MSCPIACLQQTGCTPHKLAPCALAAVQQQAACAAKVKQLRRDIAVLAGARRARAQEREVRVAH